MSSASPLYHLEARWEYLQVHKWHLIVSWHERLTLSLNGESRLTKIEETWPMRTKRAEFE